MIKCFSIVFLETTVETTWCDSTNIGAIDADLIKKKISVTIRKGREAYHRCTPTDRFKIRRYGAENGNAAAVFKFKAAFPRFNESTVCEYKKKFNIEIANAAM